MTKKTKSTILICGALVMVLTAVAYFLLFDDLFDVGMRWVSMCALLFSELVCTAKLAVKRDSLISNVHATTGVALILVVLFFSVLYNAFWQDEIKHFILWNLIALVGVALVDVVIASFDKKVKGMDEKLAASQSAILDCTTEAMNIVAENPSTELKKDLEELVEMLKYSDNSCITGDEDEIHTKLCTLRITVKDDVEAAKTEIDAIRTLISCRNNNIKNKKRGSF